MNAEKPTVEKLVIHNDHWKMNELPSLEHKHTPPTPRPTEIDCRQMLFWHKIIGQFLLLYTSNPAII